MPSSFWKRQANSQGYKMAFIRLNDNNVVILKLNQRPGNSSQFIEAYDGVVCGLIHDGSDSYQAENFSSPSIRQEAALQQINDLYDNAILLIQNGYSDQEIKTFPAKQDAIREYEYGGIQGLSASNLVMIRELVGSNNPNDLQTKLDRMVAASDDFKYGLAVVERERDIHITRLAEGEEPQEVLDSLNSKYDELASGEDPRNDNGGNPEPAA
jgi:hypothetical protein